MGKPAQSCSRRPYRRGLIALGLLPALLACGFATGEEKPDAYLINLNGAITEAYYEAVKRKIEYVEKQGVETIIIEFNTPGGTIQSSMKLADLIFQREDLNIVAYVHTQALSGGTMVALACREIYIDGAVGMLGDVAPIAPTGEILGEKIQTVLREAMGGYARARGYPEALVQAMVTKEIEVFRVQKLGEPEGHYSYVTGATLLAMPEEERAKIAHKALVVPAGHLLTMRGDRAVEYGFARRAVRSRLELYDVLGLKPDNVEQLYLTGSERVLVVLDMFSPLLIAAGLVLLFIEISNPGFGLPGILGIGCLVSFFVIKYTLHYAHLLEILLFLAGLALLLVEIFFIPGFGIVGGLGIALLFVSLVLAFQEFGIPVTQSEVNAFQYNLLKVIGSLAVTVVSIAVLLRLVPSIPLFGRIVLRHDLAAAHAGDVLERRAPGLAEMVGEAGVAITSLRPAGRAEFGDRQLDVVAEGDFIETGARIRIIEVHGNRIVVEARREA